MKKLSAGWLALIVVFFATIIMLVFGLPLMNKDGETVAPVDTTATNTQTTKPEPTAEAKPAAEETAPATKTARSGPTAPSFDVLRVEPDGSTVIAGNGEPGAKLEIMDGDKVLSTSKIESSGDFAAVLDTPLSPGDHQLTLKTTAEDGKSLASEEVATISVPSDAKGQLLAMVTKPGEASRIITAPADAQKPAAAPSVPAAASEPAATPPATAETTEKAEGTPAPSESKPAEQVAATAGEPDIRINAVELEGDKIFVAGLAAPGARIRAYADGQLIGEYPADDKGRFVIDGAMNLSVGDHEIRADVVDADGKVLVRATVPFNRPEGEAVAAVANEQPAATDVAQAEPAKTASPDSDVTSMANFDKMQFEKLSTEATKALNLLKGLYADGKTPTAEQLAAARSALEIALKSVAEYKFADETDADTKASLKKVANHAAKALAALKALPADAAALGPKLASIEGMLTGTIEMAVETAIQTPSMPAASSELANKAPDMSAMGVEAKPEAPAAAETSSEPVTPPMPATSTELANKAPDMTTEAPASGTGTETSEPKTIVQAPLQKSDTSVIIRRGDTLWQIARRVYGKGVRYTTIYLANEDKIRNPDMIEPGQVFGLPDKAAPNAEEMHKRHLKGLPMEPSSN